MRKELRLKRVKENQVIKNRYYLLRCDNGSQYAFYFSHENLQHWRTNKFFSNILEIYLIPTFKPIC